MRFGCLANVFHVSSTRLPAKKPRRALTFTGESGRSGCGGKAPTLKIANNLVKVHPHIGVGSK